MSRTPVPGTVIPVKVGPYTFETVIDEGGQQRFRENKVVRLLLETARNRGGMDLNQLAILYLHTGAFSQEDYLRFYVQLGYTVGGLSELSFFSDLTIENPLWERT